jgi:hypothetical protein
LKIFQWTVGTIIIPVAVAAYPNPYVQNSQRTKAVLYQDKIKTKVVIAKIDIGFPKK